MERWDPVSKQSMFKAGVVRIEKCVAREKDGKIPHAKEQQSDAREQLMRKQVIADNIGDDVERQRHTGFWLASTVESESHLLNVYEKVIPALLHDLEIQTGLRILERITRATHDSLKQHCKNYDAPRKNTHTRQSRAILDAAIPERLRNDKGTNAYEALSILQGLLMYLSYISGFLLALSPSSQACWDREFAVDVAEALEEVGRQQAWVKQQIKVKAPQTLVVPSRTLQEDLL